MSVESLNIIFAMTVFHNLDLTDISCKQDLFSCCVWLWKVLEMVVGIGHVTFCYWLVQPDQRCEVASYGRNVAVMAECLGIKAHQ